LLALQKEYRDAQKMRSRLRDEEFDTQKEIELAKVRAQSNWAPLPLIKIISEIERVVGEIGEIRKIGDIGVVHKKIDDLFKQSKKLISRLQRPNPEDIKPDPKLISRLGELKDEKSKTEGKLKELDKQIENYAKKEKKVRTELIDLQRELRQKQSDIHGLENERNGVQIDVARFEEREQNLLREMREHLKDETETVIKKPIGRFAKTDELLPEIQRLRYKLELIGGIDPEIVAEYEEIKERHEFLDEQVKDLHGAVKGTEKIIDELDEQIKKQSEKAFKKINEEFKQFFKVLFDGGSCSLVKMTRDEMEEDVERSGEDVVPQDELTAESVKARIKERRDRVVGIDIQATPPGKKLKALNLLSGGERALTSIALLSAIMAVNPSPFVVLDEVDAALDETNTYRFANILEELSKLTQYIIVTHNRATMEKADILYGVTMGNDGISNLLSVNISDIESTTTK
jgi:chromosome segregation protein